MDRELSEKIPVISYVMTCVVVLYHCESPADSLAVSSADLWWNQQMTHVFGGDLAILFLCWFFGLSAFLLFRDLSFQNLGRKLLTRVKSLLIPYILWEFLYAVKAVVQGADWTIPQMLAQIFFLRMWPPLPPLWYIYALFLLALCSPLLLLLFRNKTLGWLLTAAVIVLINAFWDELYIRIGLRYYILNIILYLPAYLIGAFFGSLYAKEKEPENLRYAVGFLLVGVLLGRSVENLLPNVALAVLPMLMLFRLPVPDWAKNRRLYRASFLLYATHESFISLCMPFIRRVLFAVMPSVALVNLAGRALLLLLVIGASFLAHALMDRFTPKTLRLLTGGRC